MNSFAHPLCALKNDGVSRSFSSSSSFQLFLFGSVFTNSKAWNLVACVATLMLRGKRVVHAVVNHQRICSLSLLLVRVWLHVSLEIEERILNAGLLVATSFVCRPESYSCSSSEDFGVPG